MKTTKLYCLPLKYIIIAIASILALAIIFGAIFGINTSTELSGGSQIKIEITGLNSKSVLDSAKGTLSKNHIVVEGHSVEDNGTKTNLVIVATNKKISNAEAVRAELATKLGISIDKISDFKTISPAFNPTTIILFGVGTLVAIVLLFLISLKRYKLVGALTLTLASLADIITYLSVLILTRIWLNSASLVSLVISLVITNIMLVYMLENITGSINLKQYSSLSEKEITTHFAEKLFVPSVFVCGALVLMGIALLFVINAYVQIFALSMIVAGLISFFVTLILSTSVYYNLLLTFNLKSKQKTTKKPVIKKRK